ncbi:unnamed protein product [Caenorhabditis nigoni]
MISTPAYNWDNSTRTYLTGRFTLGIFLVLLILAILIAFCIHVRMDFIREKKRRSGKVCMIPSGPKNYLRRSRSSIPDAPELLNTQDFPLQLFSSVHHQIARGGPC